MVPFAQLSTEALEQKYRSEQIRYAAWAGRKRKLNMARGKPSTAQLDMVSDILQVLPDAHSCISDGVDTRTYGELCGLRGAREYWAQILGCRPEQTIVGGASSLTLMYDLISKAYTHGLPDSPRPWCREEKVKFLCPCPGYDRHFRITESFGAELISVPMTPDGPQMELVEQLVQDAAVKGIWCVPKFSNPQGITYSEQTVRRLAELKPAAPDFVLMWDNAYCIHEFSCAFEPFPDIVRLCADAGRPEMCFEFASTSKITFPGSGISVLAASERNIAYLSKLIGVQMISFDKVNQLRHVRYLQNRQHTLELMRRHAELLAPKFETVIRILEKELGGLGIASWNVPKGGYFISLDAMPGTAKRTWTLCNQAGVTLTPAGATYPYGIDPQDSNLRIAPTMPPVEELEQAMEILCSSLRLAALEKLLQR